MKKIMLLIVALLLSGFGLTLWFSMLPLVSKSFFWRSAVIATLIIVVSYLLVVSYRLMSGIVRLISAVNAKIKEEE